MTATRLKQGVLAFIASFFVFVSAQAATLYGVEIADKATLADQELVLNGVGIRKKGPFKVYLASLYLSEKTNSTANAVALESAKRVSLRMMRNVKKKKMVDAIVGGFKDNTKDIASIQSRVDEFVNYMDNVKKGDNIEFDYIPETGTNISINGDNKGTILGKDFFDALLNVWLGDKPADKRLKAAMLAAK